MKKLMFLCLISIGVIITSCNNLDLRPLSEGSSENWYSDETEMEMAVAFLFNLDFWDQQYYRNSKRSDIPYYKEYADASSDDWVSRNSVNAVIGGTITSQTNFVVNTWDYAYRCIAAANRILVSIEEGKSEIPPEKLNIYAANAKFARASQYSKLIFLYGDVPFYTNIIDIDEAFSIGRTSKKDILNSIYSDYDFAIENLPESYSNENHQFATKGAALALKARIALYMGDWITCKNAAKACIDLGVYKLHSNYQNLFLSSTKKSDEIIFANPRSVELGQMLEERLMKCPITRNSGGFANRQPSWELFCSYLCTDGLPIDESPLFNPQRPFDNRDPRCTATIVEFQTEWLGYIYQPHPDSVKVLKLSTGQYVTNEDSKGSQQYASYNGLSWKKWIDEDWLDLRTDPNNIVIRYADVLLMYSEAKIELGEIDQSVLDAMNQVRARAYGVAYSETNLYPSIFTTNQDELRKILRIERRMEFAFEGLRYPDLIRWRLANKVLNKPIYGLLDLVQLRDKVTSKGLWFFPETPSIDEDGSVDFTSMFDKGLIKLLVLRHFDESKQYLWPIPATEVMINPNIVQNPNY